MILHLEATSNLMIMIYIFIVMCLIAGVLPSVEEALTLCDGDATIFHDIGKTHSTVRLRKNVTLYSIRFNLDSLSQFSNSTITEDVTIKADTVYMTKPLLIDFNLNIWARTIILSHPIIHKKTSKDVTAQIRDCHIQINDAMSMRIRRYEHLLMVDKYDSRSKRSAKCKNRKNLDIRNWYDFLLVDMMYICTYALMTDDSNFKHVEDISNFVLSRYKLMPTNSNQYGTYLNAQKFHKIKLRLQPIKIHMMSEWNGETLLEMSKLWLENFAQYSERFDSLTSIMSDIKSSLQDLNTKFDIAENMNISRSVDIPWIIPLWKK